MSGSNIAGLINVLGYTVGIALYLMLLVMVLKHPAQSTRVTESSHPTLYAGWSGNGLLLVTAMLGLLWNLGAFAIYQFKGIGYVNSYPIVSAIPFTALGFLPAVVVHSVLRGRTPGNQQLSKVIAVAAYSLSATAGLFQFYDAIRFQVTPSLSALRLLTFGYLALLVLLFISTRRHESWKKAIWASALAVFAVSALHLGNHRGGTDPWYIELTGHHASLPLVLAILYEDYRFAFADIFLKRAVALLILVALALGLYVVAASPFLNERRPDGPAIGILIGLWVLTALLYPWLRRRVAQVVDRIILRRVDYGRLRVDVAQLLTHFESSREIMEAVCAVLAPALSAREVRWIEVGADEPGIDTDSTNGTKSAFVLVPNTEPPYYGFEIGNLAGGRRLLSDDIAMLEAVAIMVARRIDAIRVTHERCEQSLREQEIHKLATEAQLRALRAQVNPHFLFNALTTISYLVQTAPDRALETLMKLTSLLRAVLRTDGEFVSLEQELQLIGSYLDIERARFEERLRVSIDVPEDLLKLRVPSLVVQPLVENAIKHGITPSRFGGEVSITARLEGTTGRANTNDDVLTITVSDTGIGASDIELARGRRRGVGLANIEERLRCYSGRAASLRIESTPGEGTVVQLRLPVGVHVSNQVSAGSVGRIEEKRGA